MPVTARTRPVLPPIPRGFMPAVGGDLTVQFPGERMRCQVERIIDDDRVIIAITSVPMSKTHQYRMGDKTGARRRTEYGRDVWEALDDRDFLANRSPNEPLVIPMGTYEGEEKKMSDKALAKSFAEIPKRKRGKR